MRTLQSTRGFRGDLQQKTPNDITSGVSPLIQLAYSIRIEYEILEQDVGSFELTSSAQESKIVKLYSYDTKKTGRSKTR